MLSILAPSPTRSGFCDGVSRRNFLKIGTLGLGGLALPQLLQAEAASGIRQSHKAVIMIFLPGGPSHQDMFDLKSDAPREVRGEFRPIATNVPGIHIPDSVIRRMAGAEKPAMEGRQVCIDLIQEIREIKGISGIHVMAYRQEETVAEIIQKSGVLAGRVPWYPGRDKETQTSKEPA